MLSQLRAGIDVVCPVRERSGGSDAHPSRLDRRDERLHAEDIHDPRLASSGEITARLIEFGRFAADRRAQRGLGKPETFNFLGFTFICEPVRFQPSRLAPS
jgi:hypothetical protein